MSNAASTLGRYATTVAMALSSSGICNVASASRMPVPNTNQNTTPAMRLVTLSRGAMPRL